MSLKYFESALKGISTLIAIENQPVKIADKESIHLGIL